MKGDARELGPVRQDGQEEVLRPQGRFEYYEDHFDINIWLCGIRQRKIESAIRSPQTSKSSVSDKARHVQPLRRPESEYRDYVDRVEGAGNEATMVYETSVLLKKFPRGYRRASNRLFTNALQNVGYHNGLSAPQPDFTEGLEEEESHPFPVADHVSGATLYKNGPFSLTLPHLAG